VNVSTDLALCRACGHTFSYAQLVGEQDAAAADLEHPPKGAWFRRDMTGFEVGATTRSASAIFLVPFMCVWSGFSLGGIYGTQIVKGQFDPMMSLFGIPFLLGTLLFGSIAVMAVCGKVVVRVIGSDGIIFTGVGPVGWKRRFRWDGVSAFRITETRGRRGSTSDQITMEGGQRMSFASGISAPRMDFMVSALRQMRKQFR